MGQLESFANHVFQLLHSAIDAEYPPYADQLDPHVQDAVRHELRIRSHIDTFVGRDRELEAMMRYVKDDAIKSPLLVQGAPGSGKTALMSKFAKMMEDDASVEVVKFLVGTTPSSVGVQELLKHVVKELQKVIFGMLYMPDNGYTTGPDVFVAACMHA